MRSQTKIMKPKITLLVGAALASVVVACSHTENPDVQAPPENFSAVSVSGEQTQTLADPKVDLLFVVDNSGSMDHYQDKLSKNIELFSNLFFQNSRIDYRIGVVPIYDSKYLNDQTVYRSGKRKMNALGELMPLKGLDPKDTQSHLFITRETLNPKQVLQQTVLLGTQWGPEAEESFSPVLAIADPQINTTKNGGFYEPDAYLAVIFLTDADDVTPGLSGDDFYQRLLDLKGGDKSKVIIAAALPNLNNNSPDCTKDGRGPLQSFPALMAISGGLWADLCSPTFGARLADFGQYLTQHVAEQKIDLGFTPDITTLQVRYGLPGAADADQVQIPRGANGYLFDPDRNEVVISSTLKLTRQVGAVVTVTAVPADLANYKNGRLKY